MSFSARNFPTQQTLRRRRMAIFRGLRQNLFLKTVSVFTAIIFYIFVQTEHSTNPQATLQLQADLVANNLSQDLELDADQKQIPIRLTGPHLLVENFKDGDIKAVVETGNLPLASGKTHPLEVHYIVPRLRPDALAQVHVEGPQALRLQLYLHTFKPLTVRCDNRTPPPGYHFGHFQIQPDHILCSGREENVKRVKTLVVDPSPQPDGHIDGEFGVIALDANEDIVSNVVLTPPRVKVKAPLIKDPPMRNVFISPKITSLPLPPYRVEDVTVTPDQVRIVSQGRVKNGEKGSIDRLYTIDTQNISLQNAAQDEDLQIALAIPADVAVFDHQGHPLKQVRVHIKIGKTPQVPTDPLTAPNLIPNLPPNSNE